MGKYIFKRLWQTVVVLLIVSIGTFLLVSMLPGDPVYAMLGEDIAPEQYQQAYLELGLDKPMVVRYFYWLTGALGGDFGNSFKFHKDTLQLIMERLPTTLYLSILALLISMPIGILFGVITAVHRGKPIDTVVTLIANLTACLPRFWVGVLVMYIFALKLGWLPSFGFTWPWVDFTKSMKQLAMPLFCLALGGIAQTTRQTRSSMLEVIRQDYVRTARAKGQTENRVIYIHALKNALIPVITLIGMRLGGLIGGSIFVESVFSINGMGSLFVKSIQSQDIPVIQACVLLTSVVYCIANLLADVLYAVVDPRIRID